MKKFVAAAAAAVSLLAVSASVFAAVPSLAQVEQSVSQRNWQRADAQLSEVIQAHPDSARAHYLYGQVLDREGRAADALAQIERAKSLDPSIHFTNPSTFAQTEARVRADANRAGERRSATSGGALQPLAQPQAATQSAPFAPAAPARHGPSVGMWIALLLLVAVIALVLRWTLRRARSGEDKQADDERRAQLKRATELLNEVRPLKLDARLSTAPGAAALASDIEGVETDARTLVETLSTGKNPVPPYQLEDLEHRFASLKARVEGRPDPNAAPASPAAGTGSVFAQEADRLTGTQAQPPYPPSYPQQQPYPPYPPQQPPVIVQQGGGFGSGMGGLLTGVLLGEAMSGGRERVVERDVIVDDERRRANDGLGGSADNGGGNDAGFDFGQGGSWDSGGNDGGVDLGSSSDDDWNNS
ncbi:tetratricopeptide repeat protein [Burkholderia glumae]|uniref:Tetratricopeptide repeat protein n=1 Tax=Burkholderia glumae TaxID=337 RepID=A0AAP9Y3G7_BURGL|nr:tetratricopeptide repeat protein [Burkholderia glumae]AJY67571.1 tetratricopeptide repeat family protein [Burkholderia glumae LMG 2196 = ATCC 33617]MCM2480509.1 tetratricopeptide repeat protein [Burkholderia glumae]MCM2506906.1 tetratricopeptide repeat protein [Burkholderia glumae]MCM2538577.1 tetratricopeptide repeat protein [Burkholderia glumae]PNL01841.1 hypothetical protein CEQ24_023085 [Burkholderia glumae]